MRNFLDPESKALIRCLVLALVACIAVIFTTNIRPVGAEDDCSFNTYDVIRLPGLGLVCFWEPRNPIFERDQNQ